MDDSDTSVLAIKLYDIIVIHWSLYLSSLFSLKPKLNLNGFRPSSDYAKDKVFWF